MRKRVKWQVVIPVAALVVVLAFVLWNLGGASQDAPSGPRVQFHRGDELVATFFVELATTTEQQVRGLMEREHLAEDSGMLFIYTPPRNVGMWMKNMLISLDFLFIDERRVVVHTEENVPPCPEEGVCPSIMPGQPVKYVLEVPAGTIQRYGLQIGDLMRTIVEG